MFTEYYLTKSTKSAKGCSSYCMRKIWWFGAIIGNFWQLAAISSDFRTFSIFVLNSARKWRKSQQAQIYGHFWLFPAIINNFQHFFYFLFCVVTSGGKIEVNISIQYKVMDQDKFHINGVLIWPSWIEWLRKVYKHLSMLLWMLP